MMFAMRGTRRERQVAEIGRRFGYLVGSLRHEGGPGDQLWIPSYIAVNDPALLIEVKGTTDFPWRSTWGPDKRAEMIEAGVNHFLTPLLAWWPPGLGAPIWLPVEDWPA